MKKHFCRSEFLVQKHFCKSENGKRRGQEGVISLFLGEVDVDYFIEAYGYISPFGMGIFPGRSLYF